MNRNFLKVGALAGVASLALLAAGPALAAAPISQAKAEGLNLSLAGNKLVAGITTATNDGKKQTKVTNNTLPGVAGVTPGTNIAGLGVVLQDAYAKTDGTSSACAGLTGQGGGLVQVGTKPCSIEGGQATSLDLATLDLGNLIANPDTIVGQLVSALGLNAPLASALNSVLKPITSALSSALGNVGLTGSLGVVAGMCQADPDSASGKATIANSHLGITLGGQTVDLVKFPADPAPNTHVLTNLDAVTKVVLQALTTDITSTLNNPVGSPGGTPLGALGDALTKLLGPLTGTLGAALDTLLNGTVQTAIIEPLVKALQPLLKVLEDNVLDITLNEQPVPQKAKTFETTAMDLQVLPILKQFTNGSLIGGTIGHVVCGPNSRVGGPTTPASPTPTNNGHHHIPKHVDSGLAGHSSNANVILAGTTALLAMAGAASLVAYRRFWMPKA